MKKANILKRALLYSKDKHKDQKYGDRPFIVHPILVAQIIELVEPNDTNLICAGYLHDILEDCKDITYENIEKEFNTDIAELVYEVTKTDYNTFPNLKTARGVVLKFADRLANLSNIAIWDEERQQRFIAKSTFWKI